VSCGVAQLGANESVTFSIRVTAQVTGTITNGATVTAAEYESAPGDEADEHTLTVGGAAALRPGADRGGLARHEREWAGPQLGQRPVKTWRMAATWLQEQVL
jgi:hypothetical protein